MHNCKEVSWSNDVIKFVELVFHLIMVSHRVAGGLDEVASFWKKLFVQNWQLKHRVNRIEAPRIEQWGVVLFLLAEHVVHLWTTFAKISDNSDRQSRMHWDSARSTLPSPMLMRWYTPEMPTCNFPIFVPFKKSLQRLRFTSDDEVRYSIKTFFWEQRQAFHARGIDLLVTRLEKCINKKKGDYF